METFNIIISVVCIFTILVLLRIEKIRNKKFQTIDLDDFIEKHHKKIIIIFLILIGISRIYKIGALPLAIGVDEAGAAYDAYCIANYGTDRYLNSFPLYLVNFGGGQSALYAYLNALFIKMLGKSNILIARLPALLSFIMAIYFSYKLVQKKENKKVALIFTGLIIMCPWLIIQSRFGLDCNLLGPFFILDLYLLENAKKNYQYILAGISIGMTLYTYSLSYIILPVFLIVWSIYHLYTKTTSIKKIILLACTILPFAIPLIYFLLLNFGIFTKTNFGMFTTPKLPEFRAGEVALQNIILLGPKSLKNIFFDKNTFYYLEFPFFIIGIIKCMKTLIITIKKKEYSFRTLMLLSFFSILLANLMVDIPTTNKANILYIPILYFTSIGIIELIKNKKILWIILIITYLIQFSVLEIYYYSDYALKEHHVYEDITINKIANYLNENDMLQKPIYLYTYGKSEPYIYLALERKTSPYEYSNTRKLDEKNKLLIQVGNIYLYQLNGLKKDDENRTYIVHEKFMPIIDKLETLNYKHEVFNQYHVFIQK